MHPVAVVIFVPLDVDIDSTDGAESLPMESGEALVITDADRGAQLANGIGAAAIASESVGLALDALLVAARAVQAEVPGAEIQGTAWFGCADFQVM
jgi:hypothetical protein